MMNREEYDNPLHDLEGTRQRLAEISLKSLGERTPDKGVLFIRTDGTIGDLIEAEVSDAKDEQLRMVGADYAGEMVYERDGNVLKVDYINLDNRDETKYFIGRQFDSQPQQALGFLNAFRSVRVLAERLGCENVESQTWFFVAHPDKLKWCGMGPKTPEDARLHEEYIRQSMGGNIPKRDVRALRDYPTYVMDVK